MAEITPESLRERAEKWCDNKLDGDAAAVVLIDAAAEIDANIPTYVGQSEPFCELRGVDDADGRLWQEVNSALEQAREDLWVGCLQSAIDESAKEPAAMTTQEKVEILAVITTRDEAGKHFTERFDMDKCEELEAEGLLEISTPVHARTGLPYAQEWYSVQVTEEGRELVEDWPEYHPDGSDDAEDASEGATCESYDCDDEMAALGRLVVDQYIGFVNQGHGDELTDLPGPVGYIMLSISNQITQAS